MENESQNHDHYPSVVIHKKLGKQLAVVVRSIQWSYAIFWSLSSKEEGVLEWSEGYYNGDIKTRKTVPTMEVKADKSGQQRSEQLRELYESLLEDDSSDHQASNNNNHKKSQQPSSSSLSLASLSPEDLTDAEWYYLVCMSFAFKPGQGMPGRALVSGKTVWLCNAEFAESKVFTRSLLAKSASIMTVVCFPHLGGVIEIGVTDLVPEDLNLLQHIKASLLDFSKPVCTETRLHETPKHSNDEDPIPLDQDPDKNNVLVDDETYNKAEYSLEDSFLVEGWQFMENASDCISGENNRTELRELDNTKMESLDITDDDLHYKKTLSALLSGSPVQFVEQRLCSCCDSSFVSWKKDLILEPHRQRRSPEDRKSILKKILFAVPLMYDGSSLEPLNKENDNENFFALRSIVPSIHKTDKETVLNETIKYLKELEARVEELESCTDSMTHIKPRTNNKNNMKSLDYCVEHSSENCNRKKSVNKRKACDIIDESDGDVVSGDDLDFKVRVKDQEVVIDMKCPYKDYILLDVMEAINHLHMDSHSVQSSTLDGVFSLTLKSKFRGTAIAPVGMIKQALWKVAGVKC